MFICWLLSHNTDTLNSCAGPHPALAAVAGGARGEFGAGAGEALLKTRHPAPRTQVPPVPRNALHPAAAAPAEATPAHHTDERGFPLQTGLCSAVGSCSKASSWHSTAGHPELPLPRQLIALSVQSQL